MADGIDGRDAAPPPRGPTSLHLRAALQGDFALPAGTVERLSRPLYAMARRSLDGYGENGVEAEDLVHEVWCRTIPEIPKLTPRDGRITPVVAAFLRTTLRNLLTQRAGRRRLAPLATRADGDGEAAEGAIEDAAPGVVTAVVASELREVIEAAVANLADTDRQVILARSMAGCPAKEMAEFLGMSEDAVKKRLRRARKRLADQLSSSIVRDVE